MNPGNWVFSSCLLGLLYLRHISTSFDIFVDRKALALSKVYKNSLGHFCVTPERNLVEINAVISTATVLYATATRLIATSPLICRRPKSKDPKSRFLALPVIRAARRWVCIWHKRYDLVLWRCIQVKLCGVETRIGSIYSDSLWTLAPYKLITYLLTYLDDAP